jgi:hypothetical protein
MDLYHNVLLTSDIDTLQQLCVVNNAVNSYCHDKFFWVEKFKHDNLPLPRELPTSYKLWVMLYKTMLMCKRTAINVLLINQIEKNRQVDPTTGVITVTLFDNYDLNALLPQELLDKIEQPETEYFSFLIITLLENGNYELTYVAQSMEQDTYVEFKYPMTYSTMVQFLTLMLYNDPNLEILDDRSLDIREFYATNSRLDDVAQQRTYKRSVLFEQLL